MGHYQSQCPNWDRPKVGPRTARSEATVGDSAKNHRIFATLDQKQVEHQNSVIEAQDNTQGMKVSILFYSGATDSFISSSFVALCDIPMVKAKNSWQVELASSSRVCANVIAPDCTILFETFSTSVNLRVIPLGTYDIVLGMDWLGSHLAILDCKNKSIKCVDNFGTARIITGIKRPISLRIISAKQLVRCVQKGCQLVAISVNNLEGYVDSGQSLDHPVLRKFSDVFVEEIPGIPPKREIDF